MKSLLAQVPVTIAPQPITGPGFLGDLKQFADQAKAAGTFNLIISLVIGVITVVAGIWFIFVLFSGALGVLASGGDKAKIESARARITSGLIGLVVVVAGIFLVSLIGEILGLPILNPGDFVINAWGTP